MKMKKVMIICAVAVLGGAAVWANKTMGNSITAETMTVMPGGIRQYVEETAAVKCKDEQMVYIDGSGKINEVKYEIGSQVKEGDLLLSIDDADLQLQLRDAEVRIEAAKSQIDSTKISNYANSIEIASVQAAQAEAAYNSALRALEKAMALYDAGAVSEEEVSRARDQSIAAEAALKTAELQLEEVKKGAPEYLKKTYISQLEQAVILRDSLKRAIEKQQLKSPMDGIILEKFIEKYSAAVPGTPAFLIGNTGVLELEANILSDDSYKVEVGDEVEISGKALGDAVIKGSVVKIAPTAKTVASALGVNQKRVQVMIGITGDSALLKPGYNVDVKIVTDSKNQIIAVPDSALFDYGGSSCVFVVEEGRAAIRRVKKGLEGDGLIEITEGLKKGEVILAKPDNDIKEGLNIKPLEADGSAE